MPSAEIYLIYGPPGTGKTEFLRRQIGAEIGRGYDPSEICVVAFTRTAALEIAARAGLGREHKMSGTIHAMCYRALAETGPVIIAESKLSSWNDYARNQGKHEYVLAWKNSTIDDPYAFIDDQSSEGYRLLNSVNRVRALDASATEDDLACLSGDSDVFRFWTMWSEWKHANGIVDFTDLLTKSINLGLRPKNARVLFVDELQDCSALEMRLIRQWIAGTDKAFLAGDDDQCIYSFKGSSPQNILRFDYEGATSRVLSRSYRVPPAVHDLATRIIDWVGERKKKTYSPRESCNGRIIESAATYRYPDELVDLIDNNEGTCMIIATAGYMLEATIKMLKCAGKLFWNPYRKSNTNWNPALSCGAARRVYNFAKHSMSGVMWTWEELAYAVEHLRANVANRGMKERFVLLGEFEGNIELTMDILREVFTEESLSRMLAGDIRWFSDNLLPCRFENYKYVLDVVASHGAEILRDDPKIIIGTIHSVKGGEADTVIVFPDIPAAGWDDFEKNQDAIRRLFYVAVTRARDTVVLCAPQSSRAFDFEADS